MGDVINLRQARKVRARADKERLAQSNRAKFGRTKAERERQLLEARRQSAQLDNSRLDVEGDEEKTCQ